MVSSLRTVKSHIDQEEAASLGRFGTEVQPVTALAQSHPHQAEQVVTSPSSDRCARDFPLVDPKRGRCLKACDLDSFAGGSDSEDDGSDELSAVAEGDVTTCSA